MDRTARSKADDPEVDVRDQGGDPACWLDRVCEDCGGFITDAGECACDPDEHTATHYP